MYIYLITQIAILLIDNLLKTEKSMLTYDAIFESEEISRVFKGNLENPTDAVECAAAMNACVHAAEYSATKMADILISIPR